MHANTFRVDTGSIIYEHLYSHKLKLKNNRNKKQTSIQIFYKKKEQKRRKKWIAQNKMVELNPNISLITINKIFQLEDKAGQMEKVLKPSCLYETYLKHKDTEIL